jgi:hypothetical protein
MVADKKKIRRKSWFLPFFLLLSCSVFSQDLTKRITLDVTGVPLGEVIREIGEKGDIRFSYSPQLIPVDKKITLRAKKKTIEEIFDLVLKKNGIDYFLVEGQVVLKPHVSRTEKKETGSVEKIPDYTLSGYLKDKATGEVLIGANVYNQQTLAGTTTNAYGFFSLTLRGGLHRIVFSFLGYRNEIREIDLDTNRRITIEMESTPLDIKEVEIVSGPTEPDVRNDQLSQMNFTSRTLAQLPGFVGSLDVIKALQAVPGIKSYGDGSALFYVRGGNSDQNLVMIDDAPIYTPSHLLGFISAVTPDAINDMQIYKGDFPARFGGKLSSVIDIRAKDGNMKKLSFGGNIGPYASSLTFEGPIVRDKCSFFLSGRLSTLFWLKAINPELSTFTVGFYDINGKINFNPNKNNRYFVTFYYGNDKMLRETTAAINTYGISWHNLAATFRWNHIFSDKLFSNITTSYSRYNYFLYLSENLHDYWNSSISNITFRNDLTWYPNSWNTFRAGLEVSYHYTNPGNVYLENPVADTLAPEVPEFRSMEYNIYLSNEQTLGKRWLLKYGVRIPVWQNIGPTKYYAFDVNHVAIDSTVVPSGSTYSVYYTIEPRLSLQFLVNKNVSLKTSYSRMTQFMEVLTNSTSPFTSLEVWVPCGPTIRPPTADQVTLGYSQNLMESRLIISAEAFYKYFDHFIDFRDHANLLYNPRIEGELRFGKSWSYGIEIMIRKPAGKLTGWIAYTYSRAIVKTPEINNGNAYPAFYDCPNNVVINLSYAATPRWAIAANWIYMTGAPFTSPVGFYYYDGYSVPLYGEKNNDRLPDYHRLDLSVSYMLNKPGGKFRHSLVLTLYNAYARLNPFSLSFNKYEDQEKDFLVPSNLLGSYSLVPTAISVAGIIPSINYQFRF